MPSEIKPKFGARTTLTITLASLASSTAGVGRQSTLVDNTADRFARVYLAVRVKLGTSPTASRAVYVYLIRGDGTARTDGAGTADAAWTQRNALLLGALGTGAAPATGDVLQEVFAVDAPGPRWGVAIVQDTGAALDATAGNHDVAYTGENPEAQ